VQHELSLFRWLLLLFQDYFGSFFQKHFLCLLSAIPLSTPNIQQPLRRNDSYPSRHGQLSRIFSNGVGYQLMFSLWNANMSIVKYLQWSSHHRCSFPRMIRAEPLNEQCSETKKSLNYSIQKRLEFLFWFAALQTHLADQKYPCLLKRRALVFNYNSGRSFPKQITLNLGRLAWLLSIARIAEQYSRRNQKYISPISQSKLNNNKLDKKRK